MRVLRRVRKSLVLWYHLRCARDDARARRITTPLGVWVCHVCAQCSLTQRAFHDHLVAAHA